VIYFYLASPLPLDAQKRKKVNPRQSVATAGAPCVSALSRVHHVFLFRFSPRTGSQTIHRLRLSAVPHGPGASVQNVRRRKTSGLRRHDGGRRRCNNRRCLVSRPGRSCRMRGKFADLSNDAVGCTDPTSEIAADDDNITRLQFLRC